LRLLSADSAAANSVILAEKPVINDDSTNLSDKLLLELVDNIGTLASVYHKPPELFVPDYNKSKKERFIPASELDEEGDEEYVGQEDSTTQDIDMLGFGDVTPKNTPATNQMDTEDLSIDDFLGGGPVQPQRSAPQQSGRSSVPQQTIPPRAVNKQIVLSADKGKGLQILACLTRTPSDELVYEFTFENKGTNPQQNLAVKFNKNTFGVTPGRLAVPIIPANSSADVTLPLTLNPGQIGDKVNNVLQVAVNTVNGVVYFVDQFDFTALLKKDGRVSEDEFLGIWGSLPEESELSSQFTNMITTNEEALKIKLGTNNIFYIAKQDVPEQRCSNLYFSAKYDYRGEEVVLVVELVIYKNNPTSVGFAVRSSEQQVMPLFEQSVKKLLTQ